MTAENDGNARRPEPRPEPRRDLVSTIQDALLPSGLAALPRLDLAARYLLAAPGNGHGAGGDWFDAVPISGGRVALVVGDVVGTNGAGAGVGAAAIMGQLRAVMAAGLMEHDDPMAALDVLDDFARVLPEARGATVTVAVVDPSVSTLDYCTAGHPPPLVARADGELAFVPPTGAGPLGYGSDFTTDSLRLDDGDLVVLYTDGLIRRPGVDPAVGMSQLAGVVADARSPAEAPAEPDDAIVERTCDLAVERLAARTGFDDDITLLAAQLLATPTNDLRLQLPALPDSVRVARLELGAWLSRLRLSAIDELALQQAVGELVTNAVEHAYPAGTHPKYTSVQVSACHDDAGQIVIEIADRGRWRPPDGSSGGRGLALARGFVDRLDLDSRADGTTVRLGHLVQRPVRMLTGRAVNPVDGSADLDGFDVRRRDGQVVEVRGAVTRNAADQLAAELRRAIATNPGQVSVDLSGVSLLSSAGIQALFETVGEDPTAHGVVLCAPPGSPAQQVLELAQMRYQAGPPS